MDGFLVKLVAQVTDCFCGASCAPAWTDRLRGAEWGWSWGAGCTIGQPRSVHHSHCISLVLLGLHDWSAKIGAPLPLHIPCAA